jgi:hypothetical protein
LLKVALNTINLTETMPRYLIKWRPWRPLSIVLKNMFVGEDQTLSVQLWGVKTKPKTDCHDITEILLKVALNTINLTETMPRYLIKWSEW